MRKLLLLRHGTADPRPADGSDDPSRELVRKGRQQIKQVAEVLDRLGVLPDRVLSSPYARATQTAEVLLCEMDLAASLPIDEDDRLMPGASVSEARAALVDAAQDLSATATLVVVGHEPLLSELASAIVANGSLELLLRKGGVIEIDVHDRENVKGSLLGLLRPRHIRT